MLHAQKKAHVPDWAEVLESFQKIQGDPALLGSVKDNLMLLLVRIISTDNSSWSIYECWKCLKKYGAVRPVRHFPDYNNSAWEEYALRRMHDIRKWQQEREQATRDWKEAIDLASALDRLKESMGGDRAVQDFLYKFKVLLWHNKVKAGLYRAFFASTEKKYRFFAVWHNILHSKYPFPQQKASPDPEAFIYSLSIPPELVSRLTKLRPPVNVECHHSIVSGQLNYFALHVLSSKRALSKADFWGIFLYNRVDFLECLLTEFPDKKLPYTIGDILLIALFTMPDRSEEVSLKILQLIEKALPGAIASFSDRYGGSLFWYSLFVYHGQPKVNSQGAVILSPAVSFLYGLCDHTKPNCDGISIDDLCFNYPADFF